MNENMKDRLQSILDEAMQSIQQSDALDKLNDVRVSFLGKKGKLTSVLKGMKDVAAEERPIVGQMVNDARQTIEQHLEETKKQLEKAIRERQMEEETIDVGKLSSDLKGHGGGDSGIIQDFLEMLLNDAEPNERTTTLEHSMESHFIALAAEESRLHGGQVVDLEAFKQR